ncbi:hypothetical protein JL720_7118 [Aureococcus anophagefferens]|nr:hypothetical protein JL720_7118 [Aureococcus anophagefferens]
MGKAGEQRTRVGSADERPSAVLRRRAAGGDLATKKLVQVDGVAGGGAPGAVYRVDLGEACVLERRFVDFVALRDELAVAYPAVRAFRFPCTGSARRAAGAPDAVAAARELLAGCATLDGGAPPEALEDWVDRDVVEVSAPELSRGRAAAEKLRRRRCGVHVSFAPSLVHNFYKVVVTDDSGATYATRLRFSAFRKAHGHLGHLGFPPTPASRHLGGAVGLLPDASAGMGAFLEALDFVEEPWAAPRRRPTARPRSTTRRSARSRTRPTRRRPSGVPRVDGEPPTPGARASEWSAADDGDYAVQLLVEAAAGRRRGPRGSHVYATARPLRVASGGELAFDDERVARGEPRVVEARESGGSAAWDPAAIFDFGRREDCLLFRLHSLARGDDDDRNCIGFCVLGNFPRPRDEAAAEAPELRFQLLDHDNFATSTTIYAKLRVLTKARTRALSVVRKTIVYVYEKLDEDRARGGRRHRSFFDDVACTLCSTDGDGDDDGWRRAGCSFPAEGSFGEVARPMVIESRRSLDDFAPAPDGDVVLIDWHHPGGWDPVWEYARDVESARWSYEPKSHRDVFRSTIFHRYTTTDESLLGRDVASLHELANIEIHPPAAGGPLGGRAPRVGRRLAVCYAIRPPDRDSAPVRFARSSASLASLAIRAALSRVRAS